MRNGFLSSFVLLLAGAGFVAAQPPADSPVNAAPGELKPPSSFAEAATNGPTAETCAGDKSAPCDAGPSDRFWADAEYLYWWIKDSNTPFLVTTGSPVDAASGALGQPRTRPLFGGNINNDEQSGARFAAGYWLSDDHGLGVDAGFLFLGKESVGFNAGSAGSPVLAEPFRDARTGQERAILLASPGLQGGAVNESVTSRLWGAELNARSEVMRGDNYRLSLLTGFRHLELIETLNDAESTTFILPNPVLGGFNIRSSDRIATGDFFYGGQIGADGMITSGRFSLRGVAKIAFGSTHEVVDINGSTTSTSLTGVSSTIRSGYLARPSNIGRYSRDEFAVVPEAGLTLGYAVTSRIHTTLGYSFLYNSNVLRPGDQIDRTMNLTQIPPPLGAGNLVGPARPSFSFRDTDYWAQGVNFGVEFRY